MGVLEVVVVLLWDMLVARSRLAIENLALRQQLSDYRQSAKRPKVHEVRPHLSLNRNSPTPRKVEPPCLGKVVSIPQVGGLHRRYSRAA